MKSKKRNQKILSIVLILVSVLFPALPAGAQEDTGMYVYTVHVTVDNPCNSKDMDRDAVNTLYFEYNYTDQNGYGKNRTQKFDMSWSGGSNRNADFLWKYFIRNNDNRFDTSFDVSIPGKLSQMHIKLNMDGGERLSFTVTSIECNGTRISTNTDYVTSCYYDSEARIYCSMAHSLIDKNNSSYFEDGESADFTQTELNRIVSSAGEEEGYKGKFRDQFNAVIDLAVLNRCVSAADGDINQFFSHSDETSYYKYTFQVYVENPINLRDADYDEVETFWLDLYYLDENGCGKEGTYRLDMSYNKSGGGYHNPDYLAKFQRENDNSYQTSFDVWIPGILTKVKGCLNMSGEKLVVDIEKITLDSMMVNTTRDYLSSLYFDSNMEVRCYVPSPTVVTGGQDLAAMGYSVNLRDQYGAVVSEKLYNKAVKNPEKYICRSR